MKSVVKAYTFCIKQKKFLKKNIYFFILLLLKNKFSKAEKVQKNDEVFEIIAQF